MTHSKFVARTLLVTFAFIVSEMSASAESLPEAQGGLNRAYQNFYNAYKASPKRSPEEASRLSNQIIAPAETAVQKALHEETLQTFKKNGVVLQKLTGPAKSSGTENVPVQAPQKLSGASESNTEPSPSEVLDASGLQPEIVFPGPSSNSKSKK